MSGLDQVCETGQFSTTNLLKRTITRGGSRAAATSKMKCFVILVNGFQPLTIITKHSILDVAAALDPPLITIEVIIVDYSNFLQEGYFASNSENVKIAIGFNIFELVYMPDFILNKQLRVLAPKLQSKTENVMITIELKILELV